MRFSKARNRLFSAFRAQIGFRLQSLIESRAARNVAQSPREFHLTRGEEAPWSQNSVYKNQPIQTWNQ